MDELLDTDNTNRVEHYQSITPACRSTMALAAFEKGGTLADVRLRLAAHGDNSSDWLLELTDACLDAKRYTDACFAAEQLVAVVGDQAFTGTNAGCFRSCVLVGV